MNAASIAAPPSAARAGTRSAASPAPHRRVEPTPAWVRASRPTIERIAASLARRLPPSMAVDDLIGAGWIALVELQRRHPALPPEEFARLAAARARGAMLDAMRSVDPLSRRTRDRVRRVDRATSSFRAVHGRAPTDGELAGTLGISRRAAVEAQCVTRRAVAIVADDELVDATPSTWCTSPEELTHRRQRLVRCHTAVARLPDRQRRIVDLYFGEHQTLRAIGGELGVSEARVSQLLSGVVRDLRQSCASVPPPAA